VQDCTSRTWQEWHAMTVGRDEAPWPLRLALTMGIVAPLWFSG
jgi:hypothetical protein